MRRLAHHAAHYVSSRGPRAPADPCLPATAPRWHGPARSLRAGARRRGRPQAVLAWLVRANGSRTAWSSRRSGAAGALGYDDVPARVLVTSAAFCLLSAGVYALNDVRDRREDRCHPRKWRRPVAAGELTPREAVTPRTGVDCVRADPGRCGAPVVALVGLAYVALTISYSWVWRHIPIVDLVALAGGFVLRAVAGGVAAPVALSRWFVLVVTCGAVFVAAGKRLAELARPRSHPTAPRVASCAATTGGAAAVLALAGRRVRCSPTASGRSSCPMSTGSRGAC